MCVWDQDLLWSKDWWCLLRKGNQITIPKAVQIEGIYCSAYPHSIESPARETLNSVGNTGVPGIIKPSAISISSHLCYGVLPEVTGLGRET